MTITLRFPEHIPTISVLEALGIKGYPINSTHRRYDNLTRLQVKYILEEILRGKEISPNYKFCWQK